MKDIEYINLARNLALKSSMNKRYGCVIVHRNHIVGTGYNYLNSSIRHNQYSL